MNKQKSISNKFKVDWVILDELAIGTPPTSSENYQVLEDLNIKSILCLCNEIEAKNDESLSRKFKYKRYILPDHNNENIISAEQIKNAVHYIDDFLNYGGVYIHCFASIERSPLICMAWLMKNKNLKFINSLEYLVQVHKQTNPLIDQLNVLRNIKF